MNYQNPLTLINALNAKEKQTSFFHLLSSLHSL